MKKQMIAGIALMFVASSAAASIVTPGADFFAVDGDVAGLVRSASGCFNNGSAQVTALGGLKRSPSSAPDGSQSVTVYFTRPDATTSVNGAIWSTGQTFLTFKGFSTSPSDTGTSLTKTVTFNSSQTSSISNLSAYVYMAPQVQVLTMTVN